MSLSPLTYRPGRTLGIAVMAILLGACSGKKASNPPLIVPATVHAPWEDAEAEEMATLMGGEIAATQELYEQVLADLDRIRADWGEEIPAIPSISHEPIWRFGQLEISLDAEVHASLKSGFPVEWDSLNQALRIISSDITDSSLTMRLAFDARLEPIQLARLYESFPGVRWVRMVRTRPDDRGIASVDGIRDGDYRWYLFTLPIPACPELCEGADMWLFRANSNRVEFAGSRSQGNFTGVGDTVTWWSKVEAIRALALGIGTYHDFPDSDLVAPAMMDSVAWHPIDSRSIIIQWTAAGDNGSVGVSSRCEVSITGGSGYGVNIIAVPSLPRRSGIAESLYVDGLNPNSEHRIVIRAADEQDNWSPWSPATRTRTLSPWAVFTSQNSLLSNDAINALVVDPDGRVWCGTDDGITVIDGENWSVIHTVDGTNLQSVHVLALDISRQLVWCGGDGGLLVGISITGGANLIFHSAETGLSTNAIRAIEVDGANHLWCGDAGSGVARWDGAGWAIFTTANSGLHNNAVWDIASASNGDLWFGTNNGVSRYDGQSWAAFTKSNSGIGGTLVRALAIRAAGSILIGHHDKFVGLSTFDGSTWRTFGARDSLPSNFLNTIAIGPDESPWLGTTLGLAKLTAPHAVIPDVESPILTSTINALAFAPGQRLWIGTPQGLVRYEIPLR